MGPTLEDEYAGARVEWLYGPPMPKVARRRTTYRNDDHDMLVAMCSRIMDEIRENFLNGEAREGDLCATWSRFPAGTDAIGPTKVVKLPDSDRFNFVLDQVVKRKAYAVLLVERKNTHIRLLLESVSGTCGWYLPIQKATGERKFGKLRTSTNLDSLGILWRPQKGLS